MVRLVLHPTALLGVLIMILGGFPAFKVYCVLGEDLLGECMTTSPMGLLVGLLMLLFPILFIFGPCFYLGGSLIMSELE